MRRAQEHTFDCDGTAGVGNYGEVNCDLQISNFKFIQFPTSACWLYEPYTHLPFLLLLAEYCERFRNANQLKTMQRGGRVLGFGGLGVCSHCFRNGPAEQKPNECLNNQSLFMDYWKACSANTWQASWWRCLHPDLAYKSAGLTTTSFSHFVCDSTGSADKVANFTPANSVHSFRVLIKE